MYCKYLKLSTGDDLIVSTENDCKNVRAQPYLNVSNPVLVGSLKINNGQYIVETYTLQPWIRVTSETSMNIPTDCIITAVDLVDSAQQQYQEFVEQVINGDEKSKQLEFGDLEDEISLEEFLEEDESDDRVEDRARRVLH